MALELLIDLLSEFPFKAKRLDRSVALSRPLTALMRGSLSTAPILLVRADTPGTGKSYLVDIIAMIATGRVCPVICASKSDEETQKVIGSILLSGTPIVSLDNCDHDLGGDLLCQLNERPVLKISVLGRSELPDCECRTAIFATGNNIIFKRDMSRRALTCNLEALTNVRSYASFRTMPSSMLPSTEAPTSRPRSPIIRAYLSIGAPRVCGSLGSYSAWSTMVRSPLIWLGEPDPTASVDWIRTEDPELSAIRELFDLWLAYDFGLDTPYTTSRIIEIACAPPASNDFNVPVFKQFLLRMAASKGNEGVVSAERLGLWLRKISGRVVAGHRLISGRERSVASFQLKKV